MIFLVSECILPIVKYISKNLNCFFNKKVAIIPSSITSFKFFTQMEADYKKLGVECCKYIDIFKLSPKEIENECMKFDILHLSGGDTFNMLDQVRKVKLDIIIKNWNQANKIIVGMSAGGLILSSTLNHLKYYDDDDSYFDDVKPLHLFDMVFYPHYIDSIKILTKNSLIVPDGTLVTIDGNNINCCYGSSLLTK